MEYRKLISNENGSYTLLKPYKISIKSKPTIQREEPNPNKREDWSDIGRVYKTEIQMIHFLEGAIIRRKFGEIEPKTYFGDSHIRKLAWDLTRKIYEKPRKKQTA